MVVKRAASAGTEARRRVDRLRALRGNPAQIREHVVGILTDEGSPDILRLALEALGEHAQMADRSALRAVYDYFDAEGPKRDPVGTVRVEVLRVLWHLRSQQDLELATRATRTVEPGFNTNGEMIRAAGLALLGAIDPEAASLTAARILGSHDANLFNGEPSVTAIRLLAALDQRAALLLYALNPPSAPGELKAEALRSLAAVPLEYIASLISESAESEDEAVLVGLADLIAQLPPSPEVTDAAERLLRNAPQPEVYEFLVSSIVASRRSHLIAVLVETLPREMSPKRLKAALDALKLAPRTADVESALFELGERLSME